MHLHYHSQQSVPYLLAYAKLPLNIVLASIVPVIGSEDPRVAVLQEELAGLSTEC